MNKDDFLESISYLENKQTFIQKEIENDKDRWQIYFEHFNKYHSRSDSYFLANMAIRRDIDGSWWELWENRQKRIVEYSNERDTQLPITREEWMQFAMHPGFITDRESGDCFLNGYYIGTRIFN